MRNLHIVVVVLLMCFGVMKEASALRCGNRLINEGDSILKVLEHCGQPIYSDYTMYRGRISKLYIYKQNGREQRIFIRSGTVIGVR
jgi:hypothetical protein